jgi:hypothetical protein
VLDEAEEALHQKRDYSIDFRIVLPDGTIKHIEAIGHHTFSANLIEVIGTHIEVIGTHIDVTEHKRAQEQHERLRELESDLAHMNRLGIVGEQAASLSHEMMQPIATARNNARAAMNFLNRQPPELGEVREALACVVAPSCAEAFTCFQCVACESCGAYRTALGARDRSRTFDPRAALGARTVRWKSPGASSSLRALYRLR